MAAIRLGQCFGGVRPSQARHHLAARQCMPGMIELLVTHGVDVHASDEDGRTAVDLVGRTDWTTPLEVRASTHDVLGELIEINRRSKRERAHALQERARLIGAVIDGDAALCGSCRQRRPSFSIANSSNASCCTTRR